MLSERYIKMLTEEAASFDIQISNKQADKFSLYADLLVQWNEKINLTAITDEEGIVIKHFLDSLSIIPYIPGDTKNLIDVGTGAGFPGIPIKIINDRIKVTLLDSLEKRIKYLNEVINRLELKDVYTVHGRAEDFGVDKKYREQFDAAAARAVASLPVLLEYCLPFVKTGGLFIAMKGPDAKNELIESKKALDILGGEVLDIKELTLPYSDNKRCIILIKKCRHTPTSYPRKSGKPTKQPIK
ncbi:MAG: 16S rRNA (guanine(527)-N(7))-methyltransferase RsmG [Clostridiaceae bacterium]|jgi:16S rRNA (guanine527-N7)-methyltransferase|nr:16S rRNA (guanine(527)-N(7))-methyltransferase RsmG [Clostridiaceae bacterium]